jgi:hypothetical protein
VNILIPSGLFVVFSMFGTSALAQVSTHLLRSFRSQEGDYVTPPMEVPAGKVATITSEIGVGAFQNPMKYGDRFCSYAFLTTDSSEYRLPAPVGREFAGPFKIWMVQPYDNGQLGKGFAQITVQLRSVDVQTPDVFPVSLIVQSSTNAQNWTDVSTNSVPMVTTNNLFRLRIQSIKP